MKIEYDHEVNALYIRIQEENFAHIYALDETGQVWEYEFNHRRWHALEEVRGPIFTR